MRMLSGVLPKNNLDIFFAVENEALYGGIGCLRDSVGLVGNEIWEGFHAGLLKNFEKAMAPGFPALCKKIIYEKLGRSRAAGFTLAAIRL